MRRLLRLRTSFYISVRLLPRTGITDKSQAAGMQLSNNRTAVMLRGIISRGEMNFSAASHAIDSVYFI